MSSKKKYNVKLDQPVQNGNGIKNGGSPMKNSKEEIALEKFKERVKDIIKPEHDDYYLNKWLKARLYDVDKAESMYRAINNNVTEYVNILLDQNDESESERDFMEGVADIARSMAFREKMKVDTLLTDYKPPEVIQKYLTGGFCGHDKDGSPVRVELYGRLDIKGIMCSVRKSDLEKTKLQQCEWTVKDWEEQSKKLGKRVDGLTVIFDMEGVGTRMLWRPGMQMYLHLVKILEDNYPEMMKRLCVINAPRIFPLLYKLARPLISEDMKNKIHVLGGDFKSTLLKFIDKEELPVFLGGTQTDPDGNPRCQTKICQGGDVPEQYFLENTELVEHMQTVTVGRGDKILIEQTVEKPGSILRWEFKTEDYDIGFSLLMKKNGENIPVIPMVRVNSHVVAQDGSYTCEEKGTYVLCFDNSFSWTRTKKIYYSCEVMISDETEINSEINDLIENGDWDTLAKNFETTHL